MPSEADMAPFDVSICLHAFSIAGCGSLHGVGSSRREGLLAGMMVDFDTMRMHSILDLHCAQLLCSHMLVSKIKPCMFKKLVVGPWVGSIGPPLVCTGCLVPSAGDAFLALTGRVVPPALTPLAPYEKSKSLGSGGSMVARLKLKGIDGRAPPGVEPAA
ncbi:hypothetical protein VNO77_27006 [Canavalia gladiata]|uniref:Uncharacterized protein n=1 Tax=Canavalia gladiata TaxID=3824 RepID=A0AAN9KX11_CANGL